MKKIIIILFIVTHYFAIASETDNLTSINEDRKRVLLYGIDSEIKELISKLTKESISGYDKELLELLENSYDETIKISIYDYFAKMENNAAKNEAVKIFESIEYEDEYSKRYLESTTAYLGSIKFKPKIATIKSILDVNKDNETVAILKLIGSSELIEAEDILLEILNNEETTDQVYLEVIKSLGQIKSKKSIDKFTEILIDPDEETTIKNAVCFSLGEIGHKNSIEPLKKAFGDRTNFLLRRSALEALGKFDLPEMDDILIEGLRDPNWQIRSEAARALGKRKSVKALEILKYKAEKDPEQKIKIEAVKAIGEINSREAKEYLKGFYVNTKNSDSLRIVAIEKLIEYNTEFILPVIIEEYDKTVKVTRKPVMDATLNYLSKKKFNNSDKFFLKLLQSDNYLYRIFGIEGIKNNNVANLRGVLEDISRNDKNSSVKKYALSALE